MPNGKILIISIETYLKMSDADLKYLDEQNLGYASSQETLDAIDNGPESFEIIDDSIEELPDEIDFTENFDLDF